MSIKMGLKKVNHLRNIHLADNVIVSEIWRHQIFGKMNISQMIDFFETHFDRHQKQIEKTLNTVIELS